MLNQLRIQNFRGLRDVGPIPLGRINVITGLNNAGKTSLLEALYLLLARGNQFEQFPKQFRDGQDKASENYRHFWVWLFGDRNTSIPIRISADGEGQLGLEMFAQNNPNAPKEERIGIRYPALQLPAQIHSHLSIQSNGSVQFPRIMPPIPARVSPRMLTFSPKTDSPTVMAEKFNALIQRSGTEERLVSLLQTITPDLQKLRYLKVTEDPLVYAGNGLTNLIPISQMGQAFTRLINLYMDLLGSHAKVLLIDEIENGLHFKVYKDVWRGIVELAIREDVQVFATTHNMECLKAADEASKENGGGEFFHHRVIHEATGLIVNTSQNRVLGMEI